MVVPYKIETKYDLMKYFYEVYGEFIDEEPGIQEYKKVWEQNPWKEFIDSLNEMKDYHKNANWYECDGYYFVVGAW